MQDELTKEFATDLDPDMEENGSLTTEKAEELSKKISEFTMKVMSSMATADPMTGKTVIRLGGAGETTDFELLLQKEKDLFFLTEGVSVEQVGKHMKEIRMKEQQLKMQKLMEVKSEEFKGLET